MGFAEAAGKPKGEREKMKILFIGMLLPQLLSAPQGVAVFLDHYNSNITVLYKFLPEPKPYDQIAHGLFEMARCKMFFASLDSDGGGLGRLLLDK